MNSCEACRTPIEWRMHQRTKKRAPVEMRSRPDGNIALVGLSKYRVLSKQELETYEGRRYVLHFGACPQQYHRRDPVAHRQKEMSSE